MEEFGGKEGEREERGVTWREGGKGGGGKKEGRDGEREGREEGREGRREGKERGKEGRERGREEGSES